MDVTTELVKLLLSMREADVYLHVRIVQPIIMGFLQKKPRSTSKIEGLIELN